MTAAAFVLIGVGLGVALTMLVLRSQERAERARNTRILWDNCNEAERARFFPDGPPPGRAVSRVVPPPPKDPGPADPGPAVILHMTVQPTTDYFLMPGQEGDNIATFTPPPACWHVLVQYSPATHGEIGIPKSWQWSLHQPDGVAILDGVSMRDVDATLQEIVDLLHGAHP